MFGVEVLNYIWDLKSWKLLSRLWHFWALFVLHYWIIDGLFWLFCLMSFFFGCHNQICFSGYCILVFFSFAIIIRWTCIKQHLREDVFCIILRFLLPFFFLVAYGLMNWIELSIHTSGDHPSREWRRKINWVLHINN